MGPLVMMESFNIEDPISASSAIVDINTETTGQSMWKRARGHIIDKLNPNSCLCGSVVDPSMEGIVKCK